VPARRADVEGGAAVRGLGDLEYGYLQARWLPGADAGAGAARDAGLARAQVTLLFSADGAFARGGEPCPFKLEELADVQVNAFDETLTAVVEESDCDTCARIALPKQLDLDDGAEDLLAWFARLASGLRGDTT